MMERVIRNPSGYRSKGSTAVDKAAHFGEYAKAHGWKGGWAITDGMLHLQASRGDNETMGIWWNEETGKFIEAVYTLAGDSIKCQNVSAAAAIAAKPPSTERLKTAVRKRTTDKVEAAAETIAALQGTLPFDHESSDEEVHAVLFNRGIVWVNRISGALTSATAGGTQFRVISNGKAPRQITFCDDLGYHAVYVDSIVSVG